MTSEPAPRPSVVISVFNESGNIGPLRDEVEAALAYRMRSEVIAMDAGSEDRTAAELQGSVANRLWARRHL